MIDKISSANAPPQPNILLKKYIFFHWVYIDFFFWNMSDKIASLFA